MSTSASFVEALRGALEGVLEIDNAQLEALARHYELLLRWNRRLNLTSVTKLPEAATRHYGESLFLADRLSPGSVLDVGSGAGFPGIPVAVRRPDCVVTLLESNVRKAAFLREASRELSNVRVLNARAETLTVRYDWVTARAVAFEEILRLRIADRYALLVGLDDAKQIGGAEIVPLPWGARRVLAIGSFT